MKYIEVLKKYAAAGQCCEGCRGYDVLAHLPKIPKLPGPGKPIKINPAAKQPKGSGKQVNIVPGPNKSVLKIEFTPGGQV